MVSTRHHPRPFPEPILPPSRTPIKDTSTSTSSSPPTKTSTPPSPTIEVSSAKRTPGRRPGRKSTSTPATVSEEADATTTLTRTRSKRRPQPQTLSRNYTHHPDSLTIVWLLISVFLVIWDTAYVMGRPHTMPGGRYHSPIWTPYALYGTIDYNYGWPQWGKGSGFTAAQASLNIVESLGYIYYLYVVFSTVTEGWKGGIVDKLWRESSQGRMVVEGPNVGTAVVVIFSACVMTVSKTILYALNEYFSRFENVRQNDAATLFWLWIVPNGAWIVLPTYMVHIFGKEIVGALNASGSLGVKNE